MEPQAGNFDFIYGNPIPGLNSMLKKMRERFPARVFPTIPIWKGNMGAMDKSWLTLHES
jgi:hypothetical protein